MATIADKTGARHISVDSRGAHVRGYDFVPKNIAQEEKDFIYDALLPIGMQAFTNTTQEMQDDVREHLFSADHLVVMRSDGTFNYKTCEIGAPRPIAFLIWKTYWTDTGKALYLSGVCVSPAWQGNRVGQRLTQYAIETEKPESVFLVTQNPVTKLAFDKAIGKKSAPNGTALSGAHYAALLKKDNYDPNTHALVRNYAKPLYGTLPTSNNAEYNALFERINRKQGDAYLCFATL